MSERDEHDHNRAFCMCGMLLYDGWLNPDGTGHRYKFFPPGEADMSKRPTVTDQPVVTSP